MPKGSILVARHDGTSVVTTPTRHTTAAIALRASVAAAPNSSRLSAPDSAQAISNPAASPSAIRRRPTRAIQPIRRDLARRNMGRLLKPQARDASRATAVALVEPLARDLRWTAGSAAVAAGVLTIDRVMEATRDALPRGVPLSVDRYLVRRTGAAPPLGQDWFRAISGPLTAQEQAAAEFALWVVVAPARVTTALVDRACPACPDGRRLFGLVAWSSWRAARRVATWLA